MAPYVSDDGGGGCVCACGDGGGGCHGVGFLRREGLADVVACWRTRAGVGRTGRFDDARVVELTPAYARGADGLELGHGERVSGTRYFFHSGWGSEGRNHARPLESLTGATYNSGNVDVRPTATRSHGVRPSRDRGRRTATGASSIRRRGHARRLPRARTAGRSSRNRWRRSGAHGHAP